MGGRRLGVMPASVAEENRLALQGFDGADPRFSSLAQGVESAQGRCILAPMDATQRGRRAAHFGRRTERLTLWLLWLRGWDVVGWRIKVGRHELDLLVARGDELRLVEVKARARGAWLGADVALGYAQRQRLQRGLSHWLDQVPWPGRVSFQRVSWSGWRVRFHPPERWDALRPGWDAAQAQKWVPSS